MAQKVSIKEIAELSGVSVATVSRVLNENGRYSEETRDKVLRIVKELNYKTNMVAKSLRTNKSNCIGIIVPDITNEFFASLVLSIEEYCSPRGYSVFVCNTNEEEDKERKYIDDLESKGIDGLIYISGKTEVPVNLTRNKIPVVCIDRKPALKDNIIFIESDNYKGGYLATEELIKKGCKNILILRDYRVLSTSQKRYEGYVAALHDYNLKLDGNNVFNIKVNFNAAYECILKLISRKVEFDGVFACTDWLAMGATVALKEHNISVPDMVKVVGFDDISISKYSYPSITTIHQYKDQMGEVAAKNLLGLINNEKVDIDNVIIPVKLVVRETT